MGGFAQALQDELGGSADSSVVKEDQGEEKSSKEEDPSKDKEAKSSEKDKE